MSGGDDFFAAAARRWTREVLIGESSRKQNYAKRNGRLELLPPPPDLVAAPDDAWSATSARAALAGADLLVGLHCDGAAEPIIDFALAHGKAFRAWHGVESFWNESARFSCVLRARSAPKLRRFAIEKRAVLHAKFCKSSRLAPVTRARGARKTPMIIQRALHKMRRFS